VPDGRQQHVRPPRPVEWRRNEDVSAQLDAYHFKEETMPTRTRRKTTPKKSQERKAARTQRRRLREIMSESVQTTAPEAEVVEAAEKMKATGVGVDTCL
jgi:signal-transduction protein with cAMP-binding, CBS, and nucleotidyltransferase domain